MPRPARPFNAYPFSRHQELTVTVESLTNQGQGVAKIDLPDVQPALTGWVIFIPFTIPGELVKIRIIRNQKKYSQAEVVEIIEPSPERVKPACHLFTKCGGCQYQHISYPEQLKWKTQQVQELLARLAGVDHEVNPAIASPKEYSYRSKITPHFHKPRNGKIHSIGFLSSRNQREILDVHQCPIAMEEINTALPAIREATFKSAKKHKSDTTLLLRAADGKVETNEATVITEKVNDVTFHFLAGDFFQNNPFILPEFVNYAASQSTLADTKFLVDAYCGSGLFALSLAKDFEKVAGVEISETATDWARQNARINDIENAHFLSASAEAIFADIAFPATDTTVLIDPPRRGCSVEFLDQLFAFSPAQCVYISCDPATQMRDLRSFIEAGYAVQDVQPFDLFPQTKHLECIITLRKED